MDFKVTAKLAATELNGRSTNNVIFTQQSLIMKSAGVIAVFVNHNKVVFRGSIYDEKEIMNGFSIAPDGTLRDGLNLIDKTIAPKFDPMNEMWWFDTNIPHFTFNTQHEGKIHCQGITFHIKDLK